MSFGSPSKKLGLGVTLFFLALFLVGCSTGPGSREELTDVLNQDGAFSDVEAECITDAVFDEYGDDEDALGKISAADSYEFFETEGGVPGFTEFFDNTVRGCTALGPTVGS